MVKTLVQIIIGVVRLVAGWPALRLVLELASVVLVAVAFGLWWGAPAVLLVCAAALLVKSAELDVRTSGRRGDS